MFNLRSRARIGSRATVVIVAAPAVVATLLAGAGTANSEPPGERDFTIGDIAVADGAEAEFHFSEQDVAAAFTETREDQMQTRTFGAQGLNSGNSELMDQLRTDVVDREASRGHAIDKEDVEVAELLEGDILIGRPADTTTELTSLDVEIDGDEVTVEVAGSDSGQASPATYGDGGVSPLGGPAWQGNGGGMYTIFVGDFGKAFFEWDRWKMTNDGVSGEDYYAYRRLGTARPFSVTGPDPKVKRLHVQNWPYDSIEPRLIRWITGERKPNVSFSGNCNGVPRSVSVAYKGVSLSYSFEDCDPYEVWWNANNPGSYRITLDQGAHVNGGDREAGYQWIIAVEPGTPGSMHDIQSVTFQRLGFGNETCESQDTGANC